MDEKTLELDVKQLSQYQIAKKYDLSQTTVRYWLKKYDLTTVKEKPTKCTICDKPIDKKARRKSKCGSCTTRIRRYLTKKAAVKYLGGKCSKCSWDKDITALDFHHLSGKEFNLSRANNKSWDVVKAELDKCILLCANCHRMEHSGYNNQRLIEAANKYKGKLLK